MAAHGTNKESMIFRHASYPNLNISMARMLDWVVLYHTKNTVLTWQTKTCVVRQAVDIVNVHITQSMIFQLLIMCR